VSGCHGWYARRVIVDKLRRNCPIWMSVLAVSLISAPPSSPLSDFRCSPASVAAELTHGLVTPVERVDAIPPDVLQGFHVRNPRSIANPGEHWNSGCVQDGVTPGAQLAFGMRTRHVWLIGLRSGGISMDEDVWVLCSTAAGATQEYWLPRGWTVRRHGLRSFEKVRTLLNSDCLLSVDPAPDPDTLRAQKDVCRRRLERTESAADVADALSYVPVFLKWVNDEDSALAPAGQRLTP
jgi:hypothetical protein